MQTTLLSVAIALILALVAALVGPMMVDWGRFRPSIEAEASRLTGTPVRVTGEIDASILPSPVVVLRGLEVGPAHAGSSVRARSLTVELNLGALIRGEWRAQELHLVGPEFNLGIDGSGNLSLPPISPGFDTDQLSIERLNIEDGRGVLADSRSGARVTLEKLWFNGDVRSLAGPFKGEGAFVVGADLYAYRVAAGRAEQGSLKLRLNIDPLEKPLAVEADGTLGFSGAPRFEGAITVSRPAGIALPNGQTFASDPWRLTSKLKASAASALFEGIEFQYGPEERAVRLAGTAELKFGDKPRFEGVLAASQIDLDRAFAAPNGRQLPFAALKTLGDSFSGAVRPSFPARLGVSIDTLTLAGATIQNLRGDLRSDGEAWNLEGFELRVPGLTQLNLSGRLDLAPGRIGFTGPVSVDSSNPSALMAWLEGGPQAPTRMRPFRARSDVTLASEKIAFDRLSAEIDRKSVQGRFAYSWAAGEKPARLDADLNATELDVDALMAFADAARGATTFETPREVTLGLGVDRAVVAGVDASNVSARFRRDTTGLHVERLSIGNIGGNSIDASGRIDATASPPQGALNVRIDARSLSGVIALAEKFMPQSADWARRIAERMPQAQLNGTLALEPSGAAKLALDGRSGDLRLNFRAESSRGAVAALGDLQSLADSTLRLDTKVSSDKGAAVLDLLNLGSVVAVDPNRPAQLSIAANGAPASLAVDARLAGGNLDISAKGTADLRAETKRADLTLTVANADLRPMRRGAEPWPASLNGKLTVTGHSLALDNFSGKFGGVPAQGKLALDFTQALRIDGQVEAESLDAPAVFASLVGTSPARDGRAWSGEPFARMIFERGEGRIDLKAARTTIAPALTLQKTHAILTLSPTQISLTDVEGNLAGGDAKGQLTVQRRGDGILASGRLLLSNADAAVLLPAEGKPAMSGRVALQLDVEGNGMSPQAVIDSLAGNGLVSLTRGQIAAMNPKVFDIATRSVDQGAAIDMRKIGEVATGALENGPLAIPVAEGVITIAHGQIRMTNLVTRAEGADLSLTGNVDLSEQRLNARLALSGSNDAAQGTGDRPPVSVFLSGPIASPKRTVDVSALTAWLTLRAVELQSKQIEALEERRRASVGSQTPSDDQRTLAAPPTTQKEAPPLPPAIDVPPLPGVSEQKPARAPATRVQRTAPQPRPTPAKPLQLLPASPHD